MLKPKNRLKKNLNESEEFWCELALSLGGTIGELQERMSYDEFILWTEYRSKYGPLNPVRKYDNGFALIASLISNAHGGKAKPADFLPYGKKKIEEDIDVDGEAFTTMLLLGGKKGR